MSLPPAMCLNGSDFPRFIVLLLPSGRFTGTYDANRFIVALDEEDDDDATRDRPDREELTACRADASLDMPPTPA